MKSDCPAGWFGHACRFKCHCHDDQPCAPNGDCPGDKCDNIYFGPGCQYLDLLNRAPTQSTPGFISDHNAETCNTNQEDTSIVITLGILFPFIWFRIVVNDNEHVQTFTTLLNYKEPCSSERKFIVNNRTVDVTCDTDVILTALEINGKIVRNICDVYISGGRNMALKQATQQSSNCEGDLGMCRSDNAVDGDNNTLYSAGHCSQTGLEESGPEWSLTFLSPVMIYFVCIYNSNTSRARLQNFTLQMFSKDGNLTNFYTSDYAFLWFGAYTTSKTPVHTIKVKQSTTVPKHDRFMTLCEVESYGETICPDGRYGIFCDKTCTCTETEVCHVHSGACAPGCKRGFYGFNCSFRCSENCLFGACAYTSGLCLGCKSGHSEDICNEDEDTITSSYWLITIPLILNIPLLFYVVYWKKKCAGILELNKEEANALDEVEPTAEMVQDETQVTESSV